MPNQYHYIDPEYAYIWHKLRRCLNLLNRNIKVILLIILAFVLFLFFSFLFDNDTKNLGNNFMYDAECKHITGKVDIPPKIISYDFDKHFIVVKQKPKEFNEAIYDKMEYVYPLGRDTVYYWLIIKEDKEVLGPLDSIQFCEETKKYSVPDKLVQKMKPCKKHH